MLVNNRLNKVDLVFFHNIHFTEKQTVVVAWQSAIKCHFFKMEFYIMSNLLSDLAVKTSVQLISLHNVRVKKVSNSGHLVAKDIIACFIEQRFDKPKPFF